MLTTRSYKSCRFKFILSFPMFSHFPFNFCRVLFCRVCCYNQPVTHLASKISLLQCNPSYPGPHHCPRTRGGSKRTRSAAAAGEQHPSVQHRGSEGSTTDPAAHGEQQGVCRRSTWHCCPATVLVTAKVTTPPLPPEVLLINENSIP